VILGSPIYFETVTAQVKLAVNSRGPRVSRSRRRLGVAD